MVDDSCGALADFSADGLFGNFLERRRVRCNRACAWRTAQCAEAHPHFFRNLTVFEMDRVVGRNQRTVSLNDQAFLRIVERHNLNFFLDDVLPDITLSPVGQRKDTHRFAFVDCTAVERPQFRTLPSRVPLAESVTQREHAFFCARSFLLASGTTDGSIELVLIERVEQSRCFELSAASRYAE